MSRAETLLKMAKGTLENAGSSLIRRLRVCFMDTLVFGARIESSCLQGYHPARSV